MPISSNNSLLKKIKQTEDEIQNVMALEDSSLIKRTVLLQLNSRLAQLQQQMDLCKQLEAKETIKLRIYGANIKTGKISSKVFLSVLNGFQSMTDIMAEYIVRTSMSKDGKINNELKSVTANLSDFQIVDTFAGSFGVVLEKDYGQIAINANVSKENQVIDAVFNIVENSEDVDSLIETIVPYGKRTVQHYKAWMESIIDNDANIELNWIDPSASSRKVNVRSEMANYIVTTLSSIDVSEDEDVELIGILTGVNIRKKTFELSIEDVGVIKGKSNLETLITVSNHLSKRVIAQLTKNTVCSRDGIEQTNYYLKNTHLVDEKD
ncbi:MAG: hypothetical protein ACLRJC_00650 [Emergencia timonensis]|uniref:hypothetical protein n=1 Tax=Emergencia timonensis TaxID=1776384 RepID=UPI00083373F1|nr:hypothetical protein [Emergencia timonensis]WNX89923.1 hypothetical protein RVY71_06515 [Emergencia timonensis]